MSKISNFFGISSGSSSQGKNTTLTTTTGNSQISGNKVVSGGHSHGITLTNGTAPIQVNTHRHLTVNSWACGEPLDVKFGDMVKVKDISFFEDLVGIALDDTGSGYTVRFERNGLSFDRYFPYDSLRKLKATEYMKLKKEQKDD